MTRRRKKVVWIVRLVTVAGALIFAMLITLVTESIFSFFWFIIVFVAWYVILKIMGMAQEKDVTSMNKKF